MLNVHTAPALHPEAAAEQSALHARGTALKVRQRLGTVSSAERAGIEVCQQAATAPCVDGSLHSVGTPFTRHLQSL